MTQVFRPFKKGDKVRFSPAYIDELKRYLMFVEGADDLDMVVDFAVTTKVLRLSMANGKPRLANIRHLVHVFASDAEADRVASENYSGKIAGM